MKNLKFYWKLFYTTFLLSAFTFGGGYVIVSLMKKDFVDNYHWFEEEEMLDLVSIAQSSPGAIAVNAAIIIGYQLAGWLGISLTVLATVLPPFMIISIISHFYQAFIQIQWIQILLTGMQVGVAAVILSVIYEMIKNLLQLNQKGLMILLIVSFVSILFFDMSIVMIIFTSILLGVIYSYLKGGRTI